MRLASLLLLALFASCRAPHTATSTSSEGERRVRIVDAARASEYAGTRRAIEMPFELSESGTSTTQVLVAYLRAAERAGAVFASDLTVTIAFRFDGKPMECETRLVLGELGPPPAAPTPFAQDPVTEDLADKQLVCARVPHQKVRMQPKYDSVYDVENTEPVDENPVEKVVDVHYTRECEIEDVRRAVTRFPYQVATRVIPPNVDNLAANFSDAPLRETHPRCRQVGDAGDALPSSRVSGTLYAPARDRK